MNETRNFLSTDELENIKQNYLTKNHWTFGQVSDKMVEPNYPMWFINFWHRQEQCYSEITNSGIKQIVSRVKEHTGINKVIRIMIAGNTFGQDGDIHCDWNTPEHTTCVLYLNEHWEPNWGGETLLYKRDPWLELEHTSLFEPGKALVFDSWLPHIGKGPQRRCPELRAVMAIQGEKSE